MPQDQNLPEIATRDMTADESNGSARPLARKAKGQVAQLRNAGMEKVDSAADMAEHAIDRAGQNADAVNGYIMRNPLKSVAFAFAAGFFLRKIV